MARALPALLVLAATLAPRGAAAGGPRAVFVAAAVEDGVPSDRHVEARNGETVHLWAVVRLGRGSRTRYHTDAPALRIGRRRIPASRLRPLEMLDLRGIEWFRVEPHQHHVALPPPNPGNPAYSNSVLFGPKHGRWLGYDQLEYHRSPLAGTASRLELRRVAPTAPPLPGNRGLGTMRYQVEVRLADGTTLASPGPDAIGRGGISATVRRVSYRSGDDLVGWLRSFFNVPNVFGSAGRGTAHQTDLHQGADCADVIVGALRKAGARVEYTAVSGLFRHARPVTKPLLLHPSGLYARGEEGGWEPRTLAFGEDVRRGDVMLIDYGKGVPTNRRWDHVGILGEDRGTAGRLDGADTLLHVGYLYGLTEEQLDSQGPAIVQFLRFGRRVRGALARAQRRR